MAKLKGIPTKVTLQIYNEEELRKILGSALDILDSFGDRYRHENPWRGRYLEDLEFYFHQVTVGAIGRIKKSRDSIHIGFRTSEQFKPAYFVSTGLYLVCRIARTFRRNNAYLDELERSINTLIGPNADMYSNHHFVNYDSIMSEVEEYE